MDNETLDFYIGENEIFILSKLILFDSFLLLVAEPNYN